MSNYNELKKSCMAFQLKDGNVILIDKEDIQEIAMKIIVEASMKPTNIIIKEKDKSIEKATMMFDVLKSEKDMKPDLRNKYLKQIGELLSGNGKAYINMKTGEEMSISETEDSLELTDK